MFTGLVEEVGVVRRVLRGSEGAQLIIGAHTVLEGTKPGDSIAVDGACLTVTSVGADHFVADCMAETLSRTTMGEVSGGDAVNLERSLVLGGRLGGHLVLGHVDAVAEVLKLETRGQATEVSLTLPVTISGFVAEKGSVALDGVSLTVMRVGPDEFTVGLIPHTMAITTLRALRRGARMNVEADVIARYVYRSLTIASGIAPAGESSPEGLSLELLVEKGFI